ncbi:Protein of unknown function [Gryllus bimaculatus]|nr:Protein of unknown function [Gryllus bimaculatus]
MARSPGRCGAARSLYLEAAFPRLPGGGGGGFGRRCRVAEGPPLTPRGVAVLCPNVGYDCGALIHFTVGSDITQSQWASVERTGGCTLRWTYMRQTIRNWPWTATFNAIALRMHAAGLVAHWRASFARDFAWWRRVVLHLRYAAAARGSRRREGAAPRPLALGDLPAHLALLAAGLAAAGLAFAAEGWWRHRGDVLRWSRRRAAQLVGGVQRPWRMLSQAVMRRLYRLEDLLGE